MKTDPTEIGMTPLARNRDARRSQPTEPTTTPGTDTKPAGKVSPAAMDEVFAMLSRSLDRMQRSNARLGQSNRDDSTPEAPPAAATSAVPKGVGTIPRLESTAKPPLDPTPVRDIANEMDRQRERLAQLLRDVEMATPGD